MANINTNPMRSREVEAVVVAGSFAPAGAGAPTDTKGKGFSVARTAIGVFTVTLDARFNQLLAGVVSVQLAASANTMAQLGAVDLSARTVVIRTLTAGADADIAADANNRVNFTLVLRNSGV